MSTTRPRNETNGSLVINDMPSFWNAVDQVEANLRTFKGNVTNISSMQSRLLNSMGNSSIEQRLEALIAETRVLSHTLRNQIKQLEATGSQTEQGVRRTKRAELLKSQFLQALQEYQTAEQKHRQAQRDQIAHQMRLVKPNATDDEVNAAVNDTPNGQVFQQALMHSDQLGRARNAYQDVQARHQELVRINETITELAQLMADMALRGTARKCH
ncbi:t-SNARE [Serendipita vermifera]|nr:t-SNARE [Serendipita vermifera]